MASLTLGTAGHPGHPYRGMSRPVPLVDPSRAGHLSRSVPSRPACPAQGSRARMRADLAHVAPESKTGRIEMPETRARATAGYFERSAGGRDTRRGGGRGLGPPQALQRPAEAPGQDAMPRRFNGLSHRLPHGPTPRPTVLPGLAPIDGRRPSFSEIALLRMPGVKLAEKEALHTSSREIIISRSREFPIIFLRLPHD